MTKASLNDIKTMLETLKYKCHILPSTEQIPIDQLVVELEPDYKGRPRLLAVRVTDQDLASQDKLLGITAPLRNYREIQLIISLPFYVSEDRIPDTARLILLLNKGIELPGFELSEVDKLIYFRNAFLVPEDDLDERILLSLVGMIQVLLEAFTDYFEAVATGIMSLQDVYENTLELLKAADQGDQKNRS